MTYDQLVTFDTIVKYGSFKAASEILHKSQPSLSVAIKNLEEEFGLMLFSREGYRPVLTEQGKLFYKKVLTALETFKDLETLAKELSMGYEPEINISLDAISPIHKLSPIFEKFFQPHVTTSLNLSIDVLEGLMEKVSDHQVDFAIGSYIQRSNEIESVPLFNSPMIPVVSPRLKEEIGNSLDNLKKIPLIIVKSSSKKSSDIVIGSLPGAKHWYTSDISMKEQLIENHLGWGRLPVHRIEDKLKDGKLVELDQFNEVQKVDVPLFLMRSKTKTLGPNTRRLWDHIIQACKE